MRKFSILITTLLLLVILVLMMTSTGLLPFNLPMVKQTQPQLPMTTLFTTKQTETEEHVAPKSDNLVVSNPLGQIIIIGAEVDQLQLTITKQAQSKNINRSQELLKEIKLQIESTEESTTITVLIPEVVKNETTAADLVVHVPVHTSLDLQSVIGNVEVTNIKGHLNIINEVGGIKVRDFAGDAALEVNCGNIHITRSDFQDELVALTHLGDLYISGSLAKKTVLESGLGNLELLISPNESYVLEGQVNLGDLKVQVPFRGQQKKTEIKGIIGSGEQKGSIFVNLGLGSMQLKEQKERGEDQ